jgi:hypothetical protein
MLCGIRLLSAAATKLHDILQPGRARPEETPLNTMASFVPSIIGILSRSSARACLESERTTVQDDSSGRLRIH